MINISSQQPYGHIAVRIPLIFNLHLLVISLQTGKFLLVRTGGEVARLPDGLVGYNPFVCPVYV